MHTHPCLSYFGKWFPLLLLLAITGCKKDDDAGKNFVGGGSHTDIPAYNVEAAVGEIRYTLDGKTYRLASTTHYGSMDEFYRYIWGWYTSEIEYFDNVHLYTAMCMRHDNSVVLYNGEKEIAHVASILVQLDKLLGHKEFTLLDEASSQVDATRYNWAHLNIEKISDNGQDLTVNMESDGKGSFRITHFDGKMLEGSFAGIATVRQADSKGNLQQTEKRIKGSFRIPLLLISSDYKQSLAKAKMRRTSIPHTY